MERIAQDVGMLEIHLKDIVESAKRNSSFAEDKIKYQIGDLKAQITVQNREGSIIISYAGEDGRPSPFGVRQAIEKYGKLDDPAHEQTRQRAMDSMSNIIPYGTGPAKTRQSMFSGRSGQPPAKDLKNTPGKPSNN